MSEEQTPQASQEQSQPKQNDKEYNFRALEAKYERQLNEERQARIDAEKRIQETLVSRANDSDDDDDQPYVDHKRLAKQLSSFERKMEEKIDKKAEEKARVLLEKDRQESWMRQNPDFYDVLQHAEKFAQQDPELADIILQMPNGFERQKLVYKTIKSMGIHKPKPQESTIQQKVDSNRRSPYYQSSGIGSAPYNATIGAGKDYSKQEMKTAYDQLQSLKQRIYRNG